MKQLLLLAILLSISLTAGAQDYQFSQFFSTPLSLNPALTGLFRGQYRVSLAHRSQWGQRLETPFSTTAFSTDFHYHFNPKRRTYQDAFGAGIIFTSDRVSEIGYSVNQIMVSGAYHKTLDPQSNQNLSIGFQLGVQQRNVGYDELTFEDSFDGTSSYVTGASGELLPANNYAFGDYQLGINYSYAPRNSTTFLFGVAAHHIAEPEQSFYAESTQGDDIEVTNTLKRRYSLYTNVGLKVSRDITLSPRVFAFTQGPHTMVNAGTNLRFLFSDASGSALHIGAYARGVDNHDGFGLSSAVALVGVELADFLVGFSYDIGLNDRLVNPRHRGAFELNIAYLGQGSDDDAVPCPTF